MRTRQGKGAWQNTLNLYLLSSPSKVLLVESLSSAGMAAILLSTDDKFQEWVFGKGLGISEEPQGDHHV